MVCPCYCFRDPLRHAKTSPLPRFQDSGGLDRTRSFAMRIPELATRVRVYAMCARALRSQKPLSPIGLQTLNPQPSTLGRPYGQPLVRVGKPYVLRVESCRVAGLSSAGPCLIICGRGGGGGGGSTKLLEYPSHSWLLATDVLLGLEAPIRFMVRCLSEFQACLRVLGVSTLTRTQGFEVSEYRLGLWAHVHRNNGDLPLMSVQNRRLSPK